MSAIHELSSIAPLQEFDIFSVPSTQISVTRTFDYEHRPLAPTLQIGAIVAKPYSTHISSHAVCSVLVSYSVVIKEVLIATS